MTTYATGETPQMGDVVKGPKGRCRMTVLEWNEHSVRVQYPSGNKAWHGIKWPVLIHRAQQETP